MSHLSKASSGFGTVMKFVLYYALFLLFVPSIYANDKYAVVDSIHMLKAKEPQMRSYAADKLAKSKNIYAVEPLISALGDSEARVRIAVAHALGEIGDKRAVKPLISSLKDKDPNVRGAGVRALGKINDPGAVESLLPALKDKEASVRECAAEALGELKDTLAVEPLIFSLRDEDSKVREKAAQALGEIKDARAIFPLISALKDKEQGVRFRVAAALGKMKNDQAVEHLILVLKHGTPSDKFIAASALGDIKDSRAVESLISALKDEDKGARRGAALALIKIEGIRALSLLSDSLTDKDAFVRASVLSALGDLGDTQAVEVLISALKDDSGLVRGSVAQLLGNMKESKAVTPLIACLDDKEEYVVKSAIESLGMIGAPSVGPLIKILKDKDNNIRIDVLSALGATKDPNAFRSLLTALSDNNKKVRETARKALVEIGAPVLEFLIAALREGSPASQAEIIPLLGEINDIRAVEPIRAWSKSADKSISEYAELVAMRIAIPQITIIDSPIVISISQYDIDRDGKKEIIEIIMTEGEKINYDDPWCGGGERWQGGFNIRVRKGKSILSEQSLNELIDGSYYPHSLSFWAPEFVLVFKDYNNDGQIDFNIGQYGSCAGNNYFLFTVKKNGKINQLPVEGILYQESPNENSSNEIRAKKGTITTKFFDDGYITNTYKWNGKTFVGVGQKQASRRE